LSASNTATINVGFVAILDRVGAAGLVAGLGRRIADFALAVLARTAFEEVCTWRTVSTTINVGFT
jgi:hypothetical protein